MRLHKIRTYYSNYLHEFYREHSELSGKSYGEQRRALMADCFGASDFWSTALHAHAYTTSESIANAEPLQRAWARETGTSFSDTNWLLDITEKQIKAARPDVLFVVDFTTFDAEFLRKIKRNNPSIKVTLGWCGAPYRDASVFHEYDVVLSCVPELVAHFRLAGHKAEHVNHAFAPQLLNRLDTARAPTIDFSFIGSIFMQTQFHLQRERLLRELARETDIDIRANISRGAVSPSPNLFRRAARLIRRKAQGVGINVRTTRGANRQATDENDSRSLTRVARPPLYGLRMYQFLRDSRVSLNTHIDISPTSASNMRLFEATGTGSCLLTDWRANISELFEPDAEVVTYRSADECIEKVKYLLHHESTRCDIAGAGQRRTLSAHTYAHWAARFDEIVRESL